MAAKIKLQRIGAKSKPFYRVVVQDESVARNGRVIEVLGHYDPLVDPSLFEVDKEKTLNWIEKGAKPTEKVRILLGKSQILPPIDLAALPKRKSREEKAAAAESAPKAEEKKEAANEGTG